MTARILEGKPLAREQKAELAKEVQHLTSQQITPALKVLLVGDDPDSRLYVKRLERNGGELGIRVEVQELATQQDALNQAVVKASEDPEIDGILVPMPLPSPLDSRPVSRLMDPDKDVDGITVVNAGRLYLGNDAVAPSTASAIIDLIKASGVPIEGSNALVVGRSPVVGKPVAHLLLLLNATVTLAHTRTAEISAHSQNADIVVVAAGRAGLITAGMIKPGALVIDAGINPVDGGIVGDVDFDAVSEVAGVITPVPGGVGPLTNLVLLRRVVDAAKVRASTRQ